MTDWDLSTHNPRLAIQGWGGDAYPGQEPQHSEDKDDSSGFELYDKPGIEPGSGEYKFFYGNGQLEVSPDHDHDELRDHTGVRPDDHGPMALGRAEVDNGQALWSVSGNISLKNLAKKLKEYTKQAGWRWAGLVSMDGNPISDDFMPRKAYWYRPTASGPNISARPFPTLDSFPIVVQGKTASMYIAPGTREGLEEWASDLGYRLAEYPGGGNMNDRIKNHAPAGEDYEMYNRGTQKTDLHNADPDEDGFLAVDGQQFSNWDEYAKYLKSNSRDADSVTPGSGKFPEIDMDIPVPAHHTDRAPQVDVISSVEDGWRFSAPQPKDMIDGSVPFIYDIDNDTIAIGRPGSQTDEIEGKFTPGGIVEGEYLPGGKVEVSTSTNMPWTARHFADLWYWKFPQMEIKGISFLDDDGKKTKIASQKIVQLPGDGNVSDGDHPGTPFVYRPEHDKVYMGNPGEFHWDVINKAGLNDENEYGGYTKEILGEGSLPRSAPDRGGPWSEASHKDIHGRIDDGNYSLYDGGDADDRQWVDQIMENGGHTRQDDDDDDWRLGSSPVKVSSVDVGSYLKTIAMSDPAVHNAYQALRDLGGHVFIVGGAVRDALLQKAPRDIDLMVQGLDSDHVQHALDKLPGKVDFTGKNFGVYRYKSGGSEVEIALPRTETSTGDRRSDFDIKVDHNLPVESDLARRDFTANAMAVDLDSGELIDPHGGADDIDSRTLRTVSPSSFKEDPTRILRGLVASSRHGLNPSEGTRAGMAANAPQLGLESKDRVQAEIEKLMRSDNPAGAIRLAKETGVLAHFLPELNTYFDYDQNNPHHDHTLGQHTLSVLENIQKHSDDPDLRMSALLHDLGKPSSAWVNPETGRNHYFKGPDGQGQDHETVGAEMAGDRLRSLRWPSARIKRIQHLISNHMYPDFDSQKGARKFLNRVGPENAKDLMALREADREGKGTDEYQATKTPVDSQRAHVDAVQAAGEATQQSNLSVTGNDVMEVTGLPPGPEIGKMLKHLTDMVLENPSLNTPDQLLSYVQNL